MRVLVTRPLEEARETEARLAARGHEAIVAPLLQVQFHDGPMLDLTGVQAILTTSANGVRALARRTERRDLALFAVGAQTARTARHAGFSNVKSADGDAAALARAVTFWASAEGGVLLHASGVEGEGRLAKALTAAGFAVRTEFLYDVAAISELPAAIVDELAADRIDAVMLFSPRSARVFAKCVTDAGLTAHAARLLAICISEAAASALVPLNIADVRVASRPNQSSLLDCLG
jgi:uroporphyrinogen-III synthase